MKYFEKKKNFFKKCVKHSFKFSPEIATEYEAHEVIATALASFSRRAFWRRENTSLIRLKS